jgi:sugar phosphate isomerase/epimerase
VADREKFLEYLPWAEALGVRRLRVFDGGTTVDTAELAHAAETVRWWRNLRAARGWQADIAIETHDTLVTTALVERFLAAVPRTAILWDTHHTWKKGGEDPVATWRALGRHVDHIHVKDSVSQPSEKHPFTYVLPGTGEFPMARLLKELGPRFDGIVCLEWEKLWHPYLPPLDEALRVAAEKTWW